MTDLSKIFAHFFTSGIKGAVGSHLKETTAPCGIKDCENHSVGLYCNDCSKPLCQNHIYFKPEITMNLVPKCVCPGCIADLHPEIFDASDETY